MGRQRESAWVRNRVAGATVVRRHEGVPHRVGRVYEAFSPGSGRPVLVVAPGAKGEWGHLPQLGVRLTTSAEEGCYALEVEQPPVGRGLPEITLALYRTARALAQVEERPEAVEAMLGHLARRRQQHALVRRAVPVALAACLMGVLSWGAGQHASSEGAVTSNHSAEAGAGSRSQASEEGLTQLGELGALSAPVAVAPRQSMAGLHLDMPKRPWPGQNLAPCVKGEEEIKLKGGARTCWVEVRYKDPSVCKERGYEYKGLCYLPSYPPPKVPQSESAK